jgi:hypothetical protein
VEPKVLALVRARFLWRFPYPERVQGVLGRVRGGPVGPPGPLGLAALGATVLGEHDRLRLRDAVARKVLGWPKRRKLAHAFLSKYSDKRLKLAQLLAQLGAFLTCHFD